MVSKRSVDLARANFEACAYNAAVNHGTQRGVRKMGDLIRAINGYERTLGRWKMERLVDLGVIEGFKPCKLECEVRPGGLFHVQGCENDLNHPVYKDRQKRAEEMLPLGPERDGGAHAAHVKLVGG